MRKIARMWIIAISEQRAASFPPLRQLLLLIRVKALASLIVTYISASSVSINNSILVCRMYMSTECTSERSQTVFIKHKLSMYTCFPYVCVMIYDFYLILESYNYL